jgi:primosomal protein N' (replication factor Y)
VHLRKRCLRCHHCGARGPAAPARTAAAGQLLTHGLGTEQTERFLRELLNCPVHRVDSDAMRGREAMQTAARHRHSGEPCVILGTQMLTKGHHFPAVQLVGIIDADALLYSADFRGEERMAQLVTQVAGRAGRERAGGRVLVQTHYPATRSSPLLQDGDYTAGAAHAAQRREALGLPPAVSCPCCARDAATRPTASVSWQRWRVTHADALPADCQLIGPLPSADAAPRRSLPLAAVVLTPATRAAQQAARPWSAAARNCATGRTELVYRCRPGGRALSRRRRIWQCRGETG